MASSASTVIFIFVTVTVNVVQKVQTVDFIYGGEAKRVCQAYKLICPAKKVCALQSMDWPRAMKFPVCVHETHLVVKSNVCRKPPIPGKCAARFMRWYFNVHMGTCSWFTYSGCGGNQNNFRTAEECERHCMGTKKEKTDERRLRRIERRREKMDSASFVDDTTDVNINATERDREPKLITAPARAAENFDLDTELTASLYLSSHTHNATSAHKEKQRKKKKGGSKKRRQRNKNKRRSHKNGLSTKMEEDLGRLHIHEPVQELTPLEMGAQTSTDSAVPPKYAELRGRQMAVSHFGESDLKDKQVWMMDNKFRGERRRNRRKDHETRPIVNTQSPKSGAKEDTYYDKVKLFNILKNLDEQERENHV